MESSQVSDDPTSSSGVPLPPQFEALEDILEMPNERLRQNPLVNIIGVVKDYQPPMQTRGSDWKSTVTIIDMSNQSQEFKVMKIMMFWPRERMPQIGGAGDIVLARKVKAQMYSGYVSVLTNYASEIHVYPVSTIPAWPIKSFGDLPKAISKSKSKPSTQETKYVVWLHNHIERESLPTRMEFETGASQAVAPRKEKFSLLKDVKNMQFYDLIVEAIRIYDSDGRITLYVSDYTTNQLFYDQGQRGKEDISNSRDGDEYGYTKSKQKKPNEWPGPWGKMSLQLTAYDAHAIFLREQVRPGNWLKLRNVQVKMGNMGGCLEGYLRGDRRANGYQVQVEIIDPSDDPEMIDPRYKEAVRRKMQYWAKIKKEQQAESGEKTGDVNKKRKIEEEDKKTKKRNEKRRRKKEKKQAAARQTTVPQQPEVEEQTLDLNPDVKCNYPTIPTTPLADVLDLPRTIELNDGTVKLHPFRPMKFRANVRVINYYPDKIEAFAVGRRVVEYDILSDYSGNDSSDPEEDMRQFRAGNGYGGPKKWEWRFALQVEDFGLQDESRKERQWVVVNNEAGQSLLGLDAVNLRQESAVLEEVREKLSTLWGDLEEKKTEFLKKKDSKEKWSSSENSKTSNRPEQTQPPPPPPPPKRRSINSTPPDSDDDEATPPPPAKLPTTARTAPLSDRDPNIKLPSIPPPSSGLKAPPSAQPPPHSLPSQQTQKSESSVVPISTTTTSTSSTTISEEDWQAGVENEGFTCVIREYGVKVEVQGEDGESSSEEEGDEGGDGERKERKMEWMRVWGLVETFIV